MISISSLFADCLNGFSITDIPFFCTQIFAAACLAIIIKFFSARFVDPKQSLRQLPVMTILITFITILAKNSVTVGLIFIGVAILIKRDSTDTKENIIPKLLCATTGIGVGSGNVILTAFIVIICLVFFSIISKKTGEE